MQSKSGREYSIFFVLFIFLITTHHVSPSQNSAPTTIISDNDNDDEYNNLSLTYSYPQWTPWITSTEQRSFQSIGNFGEANKFSKETYPCSRLYHQTFSIGQSIFVYAGNGVDGIKPGQKGHRAFLGDLFEFNTELKMWRWVNTKPGSDLQKSGEGFNSSYGDGISWEVNVYPGARKSFRGWISSRYKNSFTIYGGEGYGEKDRGFLSDIWFFSKDEMKWMWDRNYGDKTKSTDGYIQHGYHPGSRCNFLLWKIGNSTVFILGGFTPDSPGYPISDFWEYNEETSEFIERVKWYSGSKDTLYYGDGTYQKSVFPGSRINSITWSFGDNLYLFGGKGKEYKMKGDVFTYSLKKKLWRWVNTLEKGDYRQKGEDFQGNFEKSFSRTTFPGAREYSSGFVRNSSFYLFEGQIQEFPSLTYSAMWELDLISEQFRWLPTSDNETLEQKYYHKTVYTRKNESYKLYIGSRSKCGNDFAYVNTGKTESYFLFGGMNHDPYFTPDLWSLDYEIKFPPVPPRPPVPPPHPVPPIPPVPPPVPPVPPGPGGGGEAVLILIIIGSTMMGFCLVLTFLGLLIAFYYNFIRNKKNKDSLKKSGEYLKVLTEIFHKNKTGKKKKKKKKKKTGEKMGLTINGDSPVMGDYKTIEEEIDSNLIDDNNNKQVEEIIPEIVCAQVQERPEIIVMDVQEIQKIPLLEETKNKLEVETEKQFSQIEQNVVSSSEKEELNSREIPIESIKYNDDDDEKKKLINNVDEKEKEIREMKLTERIEKLGELSSHLVKLMKSLKHSKVIMTCKELNLFLDEYGLDIILFNGKYFHGLSELIICKNLIDCIMDRRFVNYPYKILILDTLSKYLDFFLIKSSLREVEKIDMFDEEKDELLGILEKFRNIWVGSDNLEKERSLFDSFTLINEAIIYLKGEEIIPLFDLVKVGATLILNASLKNYSKFASSMGEYFKMASQTYSKIGKNWYPFLLEIRRVYYCIVSQEIREDCPQKEKQEIRFLLNNIFDKMFRGIDSIHSDSTFIYGVYNILTDLALYSKDEIMRKKAKLLIEGKYGKKLEKLIRNEEKGLKYKLLSKFKKIKSKIK